MKCSHQHNRLLSSGTRVLLKEGLGLGFSILTILLLSFYKIYYNFYNLLYHNDIYLGILEL